MYGRTSGSGDRDKGVRAVEGVERERETSLPRWLYVTFDLQIGCVPHLRGRIRGYARVIARVRGG